MTEKSKTRTPSERTTFPRITAFLIQLPKDECLVEDCSETILVKEEDAKDILLPAKTQYIPILRHVSLGKPLLKQFFIIIAGRFCFEKCKSSRGER